MCCSSTCLKSLGLYRMGLRPSFSHYTFIWPWDISGKAPKNLVLVSDLLQRLISRSPEAVARFRTVSFPVNPLPCPEEEKKQLPALQKECRWMSLIPTQDHSLVHCHNPGETFFFHVLWSTGKPSMKQCMSMPPNSAAGFTFWKQAGKKDSQLRACCS